MRVLNVTLDFMDAAGGTTLAVADFADALNADVLSFTAESRLTEARHGTGITHIPVPESLSGRWYGRPRPADRKAALKLARSYDVLVCHQLYRYHAGFCLQTGKPYFIVPHGSLDPYVFTYRRLLKEIWLNAIGNRFFHHAEAVVFATGREQEKAFRGIGTDHAKVINWAVEEATGRGPCRAETRASLGIPDDARVLLFIGRLHSMKRPQETIEAFARAAAKNLHLVMAGPEDQFTVKELRAVAERCGVKNIRILGPVYGDAKWGLFRAADGYISLSIRENFGYTMAEAMSHGLPMILSSGNDLGYEVKEQNCSWMLSGETQEEAVIAIRQFAEESQNRLLEMGGRGKCWIMKHATFPRFRQSLQDLILTPRERASDAKASW